MGIDYPKHEREKENMCVYCGGLRLISGVIFNHPYSVKARAYLYDSLASHLALGPSVRALQSCNYRRVTIPTLNLVGYRHPTPVLLLV